MIAMMIITIISINNNDYCRNNSDCNKNYTYDCNKIIFI